MRGCVINRTNRKPRKKEIPILFGSDGDMYIIPSKFEQDFKPGTNEFLVRGIYHVTTQRSVVYLQGHEVIEDIISTCVHETIHHSLIDIQSDVEYEVDMDDEQEHRMIRNMTWAAETLIQDYTLNYNQAMRDLVDKE
jgi:hypothetical protein